MFEDRFSARRMCNDYVRVYEQIIDESALNDGWTATAAGRHRLNPTGRTGINECLSSKALSVKTSSKSASNFTFAHPRL